MILDATSTTGAAGRPWSHLSWSTVQTPGIFNYTWKENFGLPNLFQYISPDLVYGGVYIFNLTVTNWLGSTATSFLQ